MSKQDWHGNKQSIKQENGTIAIDKKINEIRDRREQEIAPLMYTLKGLEEKQAAAKMKIAELELMRSQAAHQKTILISRIQKIRDRYREEIIQAKRASER